MKDDGQWIIMMGFLVSLGIFFLAIIISQSTLVGQTTAEGVLEFPKNDIQDLRHDVLQVELWERKTCWPSQGGACIPLKEEIIKDISQIYLYRKNAIVNITIPDDLTNPSTAPCFSNAYRDLDIHYNNGVTTYDEYPLSINC
ncbi:MAG TPA: hypothetical protein VMT31_05285 [Methanomicrobiales archaeon]|jgi:hypothetical protein|nr:hypothetical protein [Methanomicrobiales archaeon]